MQVRFHNHFHPAALPPYLEQTKLWLVDHCTVPNMKIILYSIYSIFVESFHQRFDEFFHPRPAVVVANQE